MEGSYAEWSDRAFIPATCCWQSQVSLGKLWDGGGESRERGEKKQMMLLGDSCSSQKTSLMQFPCCILIPTFRASGRSSSVPIAPWVVRIHVAIFFEHIAYRGDSLASMVMGPDRRWTKVMCLFRQRIHKQGAYIFFSKHTVIQLY